MDEFEKAVNKYKHEWKEKTENMTPAEKSKALGNTVDDLMAIFSAGRHSEQEKESSS